MVVMPQRRTVQVSIILFILLLVAGTVGVVTHDQLGIDDFVEAISQPNPNPQKERATEAPPVPTPTNDDDSNYVIYLHLTKPEDAVNILTHGIQPTEGIRSRRGDMRFYTITQKRGPIPRPNNKDVEFIHGALANQFQQEDSTIDMLTLIKIKIPLNVVEYLEDQGQIRYQGFYKKRGVPVSSPPHTEAVFEPTAFPTINQYMYLWDSRSMRLE